MPTQSTPAWIQSAGPSPISSPLPEGRARPRGKTRNRPARAFGARRRAAGRGGFPSTSPALNFYPLHFGVRRGPPATAASLMRLSVGYCATPSTVKARNVAYLSPTCRASLYSAELRQA